MVLVAREAGLPGLPEGHDRWSIDHVLLDQDAVPTIVEVKRSSDTRIRREVVGQMLDYAANAVVYWPADRLRGWFEERAGGEEPAAMRLTESLSVDKGDVEQFWNQARTNLESGRLRLVFVADVIPPELRRIVEFLDDQMTRTQVIAIEVRQYAVSESDSEMTALVPRVVSMSARADAARSAGPRPTRRWDDASFFEELGARGNAAESAAARALLGWARDNSLRVVYGRGVQTGSFYALYDDPQRVQHWLFSVWTNGSVGTELGYLQRSQAFAEESARLELIHRLNAIPGVSIPEDKLDMWPPFPLAALTSEGLSECLRIYDWVLSQMKGANIR